MPITPGTVTLTNAGTIALDIGLADFIAVPTASEGVFTRGSLTPQFVVGQNIVTSTTGTIPITAFNSITYVNLDAVPVVPITSNVLQQTTGDVESNNGNYIAFFPPQILTLDSISSYGTTAAAYEVNWAAAGGSMGRVGTVSKLTMTNMFAPNAMYPFYQNGHLTVVVDGQGTVFDTVSGDYAAANFFPTLNGSGNAPSDAVAFEGGYADPVGQSNYYVVNTSSPYELPPIVEQTTNGTTTAVFSYAFNNADIYNDTYSIAGNTPNGFFFILIGDSTTGTLVEVNPVAKSYTTFVMTSQDAQAAACMGVLFGQTGLYSATRDSAGAWWVTNSANTQYVCTGGQTDFIFAKSSVVGAECCVPSSTNSLGRYRGAVGINFYGQTLIGDAWSGVIGASDFNTFLEYGQTMRGLIAAPPLHQDRKRIFVSRFEIDVESGVGADACCGVEPLWMLDWSKDGGRTFGPVQVFRSMGAIGQYTQRLRWLRLGQSRQWIFRLQSTDPVRRVIVGTYADFYAGMGATGP